MPAFPSYERSPMAAAVAQLKRGVERLIPMTQAKIAVGSSPEAKAGAQNTLEVLEKLKLLAVTAEALFQKLSEGAVLGVRDYSTAKTLVTTWRELNPLMSRITHSEEAEKATTRQGYFAAQREQLQPVVVLTNMRRNGVPAEVANSLVPLLHAVVWTLPANLAEAAPFLDFEKNIAEVVGPIATKLTGIKATTFDPVTMITRLTYNLETSDIIRALYLRSRGTRAPDAWDEHYRVLPGSSHTYKWCYEQRAREKKSPSVIVALDLNAMYRAYFNFLSAFVSHGLTAQRAQKADPAHVSPKPVTAAYTASKAAASAALSSSTQMSDYAASSTHSQDSSGALTDDLSGASSGSETPRLEDSPGGSPGSNGSNPAAGAKDVRTAQEPRKVVFRSGGTDSVTSSSDNQKAKP